MFFLVFFAFRDPSPLYKSSNRRNHFKPDNLETLFLLSALKMPIMSHLLPSRNKILRRSQSLLWFLDFETAYSHFNVEMYSYFTVGNKIFCFFKKWVFAFLEEGTFQGRSQVLQNFERVGGLTDLEFF